MMTDFTFYLGLGWEHILGWDALDHLVFLLALTATVAPKQWKNLLLLVTAFTVGHCITLALSTYNLISIKSNLVEWLIALTIAAVAAINFIPAFNQQRQWPYKAFWAMGFGLVHGMGFANTIRFMLAAEQSIFVPLLGFNIGVELGQVMVVAILLALKAMLAKAGLQPKIWTWAASALAGGFGLYLMINRWPF
jgi:hypothetical protein